MEELLKGTIKDLIVKQLMTYLVSKLPFLAWPIVNPIASYLLSNLVTLIIEKTILGANFLAIDFRVNADVEKLEKARKKAQEAVASGDQKQIEKSSQEIVDAARDLIRLGRTIT